ncbi:MAG: hypothetical protein QJR05_13500, partial [Thermoanaerobacterium sp.]|nr:hypothetical protein [Thermoanaerobacterium sp.]
CPFCDPPIQVTGVLNKFFRAFPGQKHNCGKQPAIYFNADWKGRKITETLKKPNGEIEITIDINQMDSFRKRIDTKPELMDQGINRDTKQPKYMRYKEYQEVFRDVVNSVLQMKRLLENNPYEKLQCINFKFRAGNEKLSINEVVKLVDELSFLDSGKYRFVIFKVENVAPWKNKVYINSYITNGMRIAATINLSNINANINNFVKSLSRYKDKIVIAYGYVIYYQKYRQYYLDLLSDLNIKKITDKSIIDLFANKKLEQFLIVKKKMFLQNKENIEMYENSNELSNSSQTLHRSYESLSTLKAEDIINNQPKVSVQEQIEKSVRPKQETLSRNEDIAKTTPNKEITMRKQQPINNINNDLSNTSKQPSNIDHKSTINMKAPIQKQNKNMEEKTEKTNNKGRFIKRLTNKLFYMFRR